MTSRESFARLRQGDLSATAQKRSVDHLAHLPLYATAVMCVMATGFVFWVQSDRIAAPSFSEPQVEAEHVKAIATLDIPAPLVPQKTAEVEPPQTSANETATRAAAALDVPSKPLLRRSEAPISQQLRQPIRLIQTQSQTHDLRALATQALAAFGHATDGNDRLHALLVTTLSEGQSDAYIDAALNAARVRGEFVTPKALQTVSGRIDTDALLATVLMVSRGAQAAPQSAQDAHVLSADDSLAGLALRYYGQPAGYAAIVSANEPLQNGLTGALSGSRIDIPTL